MASSASIASNNDPTGTAPSHQERPARKHPDQHLPRSAYPSKRAAPRRQRRHPARHTPEHSRHRRRPGPRPSTRPRRPPDRLRRPEAHFRTHRFNHDELDPDRHHQAVPSLVEQLGAQLRHDQTIAAELTLTVTHADRTTTTHTLAEPTAHAPHSPTPARTARIPQPPARLGPRPVRTSRTASTRRDRCPPAHPRHPRRQCP
ncbi:hypothetical protein [Streptomyces sp. T028]|uniref:DinB/UmuC family translesion DNA polymerase n=1 Tax=Streptomyces sp. T028 TaxID=3394379 RepID=UPI003A886947